MNEIAETNLTPPPQAVDQSAFQTILGDHANWVLSEGKEGRRANFKDADLRYIDFTEAHLVQASFRGCDLRGCDLTGAQLQETDFTEAKLGSANLTGVNLGRSNFAGANLERCILDGANLAYANFLDANLTEASLRNTLMEKAQLRQVIAQRAMFEETDMTDVIARESQMQGARFFRTRLIRADLRESRLDHAQFVETQFLQTQFKGSTFEGVSFAQADFSEALEISQEYKSVAHAEEKETLSRERAQVDAERSSLKIREDELTKAREAFLQEKDSFAGIHKMEERFGQQIGSAARQLKILTLLWLFVFALVAGGMGLTIMALGMDELNLLELIVVIVVAGSLFLLALFTFLRTAMVGRRLSDHRTLRERKLFAAHTGTNVTDSPLPTPSFQPVSVVAAEELTEEAPALDLPLQEKKRGLFKKKR